MKTTDPLVGLAARQELLRAALRAHDAAIARSPGDAALKARRAELAGGLRGVAAPGELEWLRAHLAELDAEMASVQTAATADLARLQDLLRDREQTLADIKQIERWHQAG